jgi:hypothetical protein
MFRESHPYTIRPRKGVKWEAYKDLDASRPILPCLLEWIGIASTTLWKPCQDRSLLCVFFSRSADPSKAILSRPETSTGNHRSLDDRPEGRPLDTGVHPKLT